MNGNCFVYMNLPPNTREHAQELNNQDQKILKLRLHKHRFVSQWSLQDKSACVTYHATPTSFVHAPRNAVATQVGMCNRNSYSFEFDIATILLNNIIIIIISNSYIAPFIA